MINIIDKEKAIQVLGEGGIVIFPTDTAFGIGCAADNEAAVEKLFRIRQRPSNKPTPVLCSDIEMVDKISVFNQGIKSDLMNKYWPGALTIILKVRMGEISSLVCGGTDTVGVRIPDSQVALEIIRRLGKPIVGTSANFHGQPTPYDFSSVDRDLITLVDGIVEGECSLKQESTVVDCTVTPRKVVRQGAVKLNL